MAARKLGTTCRSRTVALVFCVVLAIVSGCTDNVWRGEVASINGRPITLTQVAALRNSTHFDWPVPATADMDIMRKQYGDALTNLLAVELVKQQLEKKKLAVTDAEVQAEENLIRADYPPGTFEDVLTSEAIDLETWRFLLRNYLSVQRFLEKILRPEIVISPEEASAYVKANPREFIRPPWAYFFLISGADDEDVAKCGKELDKTGDPVKIQKNNPNVIIRTVRMDVPRLDPAISREVSKMRPGDLSGVIAANGEFHQVLLLESLPEREPEPGEIYLQAERVLVGQKMHVEYNRWVMGRFRKAKIKVSSQLLPHLRSSGAVNGAAPARGTAPSL